MKRYLSVALVLFFYASILPWSWAAPNARFEQVVIDNQLIVKGGPWVDVRSFAPIGTLADGTVDWSAFVQAAFNSCPDQGVNWGDNNGCTIVFPPGNYIVNDTTPKNGTRITGQGYYAAAIRSTTATYGSFWMQNVGGPGTIIENLFFHTGPSGNQTAIRTYATDGLTIKDCWFIGYVGINARSVGSLKIINNVFDQTTYPIIVGTPGGGDNPFDLTIANNEFFDNMYPITIYQIQNSTIHSNVFYNPKGPSIKIHNTSSGLTVQGNSARSDATSTNEGWFVFADNTYNASFGQNNVYGSIRGAYRISNSGHIAITGGSSHTIKAGLDIGNSTDISVSGGVYSSDNNTRIATIHGSRINISGGAIFKSNYAAGVTDGHVFRINADNSILSECTLSANNVTTLVHIMPGKSKNYVNWNQYLGTFKNSVVDSDGANYINDRFRLTLLNAAGNVMKRVRLNNAGNGLVYENP